TEGDRVVVSVHVAATGAVPMIEILVALPPLVEVAAGSNRVVLAVGPGAGETWSFAVRCPARGRFDLGTVYYRAWDRSGMAVGESRQASPQPISVYPYVAPI